MAGFFAAGLIERVRAASDIVDVIGSVLPLKRAGANFVALCPFHKEKSPSFSVNPHRQIFYCFGCHKGGDVFSFIKEYENLEFPEAVRRLAERARIPMEYEQGGGDREERSLKENLLQIHEQITIRWHQALANDAGGQVARDYLTRRGVTDEAIKLFRLGFAPDDWEDTVNWSKATAYEPALVEKAGLIIRKEGSGRYYDRFRGRLMFPICDEQGRVIGFSGKSLSGDQKAAKYVNSPETPIFTKSKVFFGLDKSKRNLLDAGSAIVCEGQLDLISCFMAGVGNVVAPQGTALTGDHVRILKRYVTEVVLCFDSDEAGQNAAVRSLDHLLASDIAVRVAVLPHPHDPDSYIKEHGGPAFGKLIQQAQGFFDYFLDRLTARNDTATDRGRGAILGGMAEMVHKTGNIVLIDKYAQKTALRLGVSAEAVRSEFKKATRRFPNAVEPEHDEVPPEPFTPPGTQEYWLLKLLLLNEDLVPFAAARLDLNWVRHANVRQIVQQCMAAHQSGAWTNIPAFLEAFEDPASRALITKVVAEDRPAP